MNNLEWIEGFEVFTKFLGWARRHSFYVADVERLYGELEKQRPWRPKGESHGACKRNRQGL